MPVRQRVQNGVASVAWLETIAGGEQQRRILAMQVGQFFFQSDMQRRGAGDVARAARTRADAARGLDGGFDDDRVGAHGEIVIRGPDQDVPGLAFHGDGIIGEPVGQFFQGHEAPVAPLRGNFG